MAGNFLTKKKAMLDFKLPELDANSKVTWVFHGDDKTDRKTALCDMIIGLDLQTTIGLCANTEDKVIVIPAHTWDL